MPRASRDWFPEAPFALLKPLHLHPRMSNTNRLVSSNQVKFDKVGAGLVPGRKAPHWSIDAASLTRKKIFNGSFSIVRFQSHSESDLR